MSCKYKVDIPLGWAEKALQIVVTLHYSCTTWEAVPKCTPLILASLEGLGAKGLMASTVGAWQAHSASCYQYPCAVPDR